MEKQRSDLAQPQLADSEKGLESLKKKMGPTDFTVLFLM